jgi:hypothetical protein
MKEKLRLRAKICLSVECYEKISASNGKEPLDHETASPAG